MWIGSLWNKKKIKESDEQSKEKQEGIKDKTMKNGENKARRLGRLTFSAHPLFFNNVGSNFIMLYENTFYLVAFFTFVFSYQLIISIKPSYAL